MVVYPSLVFSLDDFVRVMALESLPPPPTHYGENVDGGVMVRRKCRRAKAEHGKREIENKKKDGRALCRCVAGASCTFQWPAQEDTSCGIAKREMKREGGRVERATGGSEIKWGRTHFQEEKKRCHKVSKMDKRTAHPGRKVVMGVFFRRWLNLLFRSSWRCLNASASFFSDSRPCNASR